MQVRIRFGWVVAALVIIGLVWGLKGLGYAALALFVLPIAAILAFLVFLATLAWLLRRRMNRRLGEMQQAFRDAEAQARRDAQASQRRANAVDAEGHVHAAPADGASAAGDESR